MILQEMEMGYLLEHIFRMFYILKIGDFYYIFIGYIALN